MYFLNFSADIEDVLDNKFARTKEGKCLRFCVMKKMGQVSEIFIIIKLKLISLFYILTNILDG